MEIFYKYLSLYSVDEITLNSKLINFDKKKRYVIGIFKNNILINLTINFKFIGFHNVLECYAFSNDRYYYNYKINNDENKINVLELVHDFNSGYLVDLLLCYYKGNVDIDMDINMKYCKVFSCIKNKCTYSKNDCTCNKIIKNYKVLINIHQNFDIFQNH